MELVPEPNLLDGMRDSLAGTCVPDIADRALEVRMPDRLIAVPVAVLNNESATVLGSSTLDLKLEI